MANSGVSWLPNSDRKQAYPVAYATLFVRSFARFSFDSIIIIIIIITNHSWIAILIKRGNVGSICPSYHTNIVPIPHIALMSKCRQLHCIMNCIRNRFPNSQSEWFVTSIHFCLFVFHFIFAFKCPNTIYLYRIHLYKRIVYQHHHLLLLFLYILYIYTYIKYIINLWLNNIPSSMIISYFIFKCLSLIIYFVTYYFFFVSFTSFGRLL